MMRRITASLSVCLCVGLLTAAPTAYAWSVSSVVHEVEQYFHHVGSYIRRKTGGRAQFTQRYALPNPHLTPGALNPAVTQETLYETVCRPGGYKPPTRLSATDMEKLKSEQIRQYGYRDRQAGDFEEDHLVPVNLGGLPDSPRNLWPEPREVEGGWGSEAKNKLEGQLHTLICNNKVSLATAQYAIVTDWITAYKHYVSANP